MDTNALLKIAEHSRRALELESQALEKLVDAATMPCGGRFKDLTLMVLLDTLLHRELMRAIVSAVEQFIEIAERPVGEGARCIDDIDIAELMRGQDVIEREAAELYDRLSREAPTELLKALYSLIAENERRHHVLESWMSRIGRDEVSS